MTPFNLLLTLLTVLFVGLKLGGTITWSWWLVLLPAYGGLVLLAILFAIVGLIAVCQR